MPLGVLVSSFLFCHQILSLKLGSNIAFRGKTVKRFPSITIAIKFGPGEMQCLNHLNSSEFLSVIQHINVRERYCQYVVTYCLFWSVVQFFQ